MKKRKQVKNIFLILFFITLIIITGCFGGGNVNKTYDDIDQSTRIAITTKVSGEVNESEYELEYIKDEKMYTIGFHKNLQPSLDKLKSLSTPGDVILNWWDSGHIIRGYARREPLVYTPCQDILETVRKGKWDEHKLGEFSDKDLLTNVAYAFLAESPKITQGIMNRYNAKWVYVQKNDKYKTQGMAILLGEDSETYYDDLGEPKSSMKTKTIFKMSEGIGIKGFDTVYEDDYAVVYKLI